MVKIQWVYHLLNEITMCSKDIMFSSHSLTEFVLSMRSNTGTESLLRNTCSHFHYVSVMPVYQEQQNLEFRCHCVSFNILHTTNHLFQLINQLI